MAQSSFFIFDVYLKNSTIASSGMAPQLKSKDR